MSGRVSGWPVDQAAVGEGVTERKFRFATPLPAAIAPGMTYVSDVAVEMISHAPVAGGPIKHGFQQSVSYATQEARVVRLGGCADQVIPVGAPWAGDAGSPGFQRWLYFTDLGLAIETKTAAGQNGLTQLAPAVP